MPHLYQPRLHHGAGISAFFLGHPGHRFASPALMAPMTAAFTAGISQIIAARGLDAAQIRPSTVNGSRRAVKPVSSCDATSS